MAGAPFPLREGRLQAATPSPEREAQRHRAHGRVHRHEINNPLESLVNLIFLARESTTPGSKARAYLLTAEEELERVSHLALQTLGYYRDTNAPKEVLLHELIRNVLTVYNSRITGCGISVDLRLNDLEKIVASKGEMLQVFSNVIANCDPPNLPQGEDLAVLRTKRNLGYPGVGSETRLHLRPCL